MKSDPKSFWRYTNQGMKVRVAVGDLEGQEGTQATTDQDKADCLKEDTDNIPEMDNRYEGPPLENLTLLPDMVLKKL